MSKKQDKAKFTKPLKTEQLKAWTKIMLGESVNNQKDYQKMTELGERIPNLGDISMLIKFYVDKTKNNQGQADPEQQKEIIKQIGFLEFVISNELGITKDRMEKYKEEYDKAFNESTQVTEDLMQLVQDKEQELGRPLSKDEIKDILKEKGIDLNE